MLEVLSKRNGPMIPTKPKGWFPFYNPTTSSTAFQGKTGVNYGETCSKVLYKQICAPNGAGLCLGRLSFGEEHRLMANYTTATDKPKVHMARYISQDPAPNFTIFGAEITVVAAAKVCDFLGEQKTNEVFPEVTTGHQDIMRSI